MIRPLALIMLVFSAVWAAAQQPLTVDCGAGQSLNRTLAMIYKFTPVTVRVKGTCTEYVLIDGFNGLTLKGMPGAALQQPNSAPPATPYVPPGTALNAPVLWINNSRSVTVSGFAIHSRPGGAGAVSVGGGSSNINLNKLSTDGPWGFAIENAGLVTLSQVNVAIGTGWQAVAVWAGGNVNIESSSFVNVDPGTAWHCGLCVESGGHATIQGTEIRDMDQGISVTRGGSVLAFVFDPSATSTDVIVDNPAGTNSWGIDVSSGGSFLSVTAKVRITNAGHPWWGSAVRVDGGSTFSSDKLIVSGSPGYGVVVSNNSHANLSVTISGISGGAPGYGVEVLNNSSVSLTSSSITGSSRGGLVVANLSTASVSGNPATVISGNKTDVFCDSKSQIFGSSSISGAASVSCDNLFPGSSESLPW